MKFISVFLVSLMLFLSFNGTAKPDMAPIQKETCCQRMATKTDRSACANQKSNDKNNNCDKQGCNMLLSCGVCGFLAVDRLQILPRPANYFPKPVSLYKIGALSSYYPSDWKPPKAC